MTRSANENVQKVLTESGNKTAKRTRKERSVYSDKDRAAIGRYAGILVIWLPSFLKNPGLMANLPNAKFK